MNKAIPVTLWLLVILVGGFLVYRAFDDFQTTDPLPPNGVVIIDEHGQPKESQSGNAFVDVKWERLQSIPQFSFTNQNGEPFDSADINGRPIVVSFFFASCPTICRDLNKQIQELRQQLDDPEMMFCTISVNPEEDTPEILEKYSADFGAEPQDWNFLTGPMYKVKELGSHAFNVSIDKFTHTDNILLVDRWGRYRDRFKWNDPYDLKRFLTVANEVLAEKEPPFGNVIHTRNVMAGMAPADLDSVPWIREFHLVDENEEPFFSRDLTGQVWVASFFFAACPGICLEQNQYLAGLQSRLGDRSAELISISTLADTPQRMKEYARKFDADLEHWSFLTGERDLVSRTSAEYFKAYSSGGHHSRLLFVVDKWGNVRGQFDWREPAAEVQLVDMIDALNLESTPPARFERVSVKKTPEASEGSGQ